MAKVGLKETLTLLAAGYKKKDIDALAAIDEEAEVSVPGNNADPNTSASVEDKKAPEDAADKESIQEPDYKKMYEDLLKEKEEKEEELIKKDETIKKIQKENITSNSLPDVENMREEEHASLVDAIRSFY